MLIVCVLLVGLRKNVDIVIDGQSISVSTYALTVGDLIKSEHVTYTSEDNLIPGFGTWLTNDMVIHLDHTKPIYLQAGEKKAGINSVSLIPIEIIQKEKLKIDSEDSIFVNGVKTLPFEMLERNYTYNISLKRAIKIRLQEGEKIKEFRSSASTLGKALWDVGVSVYKGDKLLPPVDTVISFPFDRSTINVSLLRAKNIKIQTNKGETTILSARNVVGDILADIHNVPQGWDYSQPAFRKSISDSDIIQLNRVEEREFLDMKLTPFHVSYRNDVSIDFGIKQILQSGIMGLTVQSTRKRYIDGKEISQYKQTSWIVNEIQEQVIGLGTKIVPQTLDIPGSKITYWIALDMYATSYSPCRLGIPNHCNNSTASGKKLSKGIVAVTREDFELLKNAQIYIPGYGFAEIADIGSGVPGKRWIDLGFSDSDFENWSRQVKVYFLISSIDEK